MTHITAPVATLGERIRMARRHAGIVRAQDLATMLAVNPNTISRWEADARTPSARDLARIAAACSVPLEWLLEPLTNELGGDDQHLLRLPTIRAYPDSAPLLTHPTLWVDAA